MFRRRQLTIFLVLVCCGCSGNSDQLPTYPVSGQVTVDGEACAGVVFQLVPTQDDPLADSRVRPGAKSDESGRFSFGTFKTGDGAPDGKYRMIAFWPPDGTNSGDGKGANMKPTSSSGPPDVFGGKYFSADRSEWEVEVTGKATDLGTISLKLKSK